MATVKVNDAITTSIHVAELGVGMAGFAVSGADANTGDIIYKLKANSGVNLTSSEIFNDTAEIYIVEYSPGAKIIIKI